jgi:hypothetical protein
MFISEQYGWLANISGDYWDAMLDYGMDSYDCAFAYTRNDYDYMLAVRDVELMMMGL